MSSEYVKSWERDGAVYQRMLDAAEAVLRRAIESRLELADKRPPMLDPVITREHSDAPQVSVRWHSTDGIERAVHVDVICDDQSRADGGHSYAVAIAASHDDFEARERRWWYERLETRADIQRLSEAVIAAISAVRAFDGESLKNSTELPPLPPGLSTAGQASR